MVASWLAPVLIGVGVLLLARSFYILYVKRCGTRASAVITGRTINVSRPLRASMRPRANPVTRPAECPGRLLRHRYASAAQRMTGSAVTGHAHSGSMSLAGGANNSDNAQCTQTVAVNPSTSYTLSATVIGASGTPLGITKKSFPSPGVSCFTSPT